MRKQYKSICLEMILLLLCLAACQPKQLKQPPKTVSTENDTSSVVEITPTPPPTPQTENKPSTEQPDPPPQKEDEVASPDTSTQTSAQALAMGAESMDSYLPLLIGKRVALVVNQTSLLNDTHLVDTLLSKGIALTTIFAPEHGFRGEADAGESVSNGLDARTGLPIVSLYGNNKKPTPEQLQKIDIVVFDIQDVGARFYTYISTMHYVMEACAEKGIPLVVLDRPNPNGHYVDGPVRQLAQRSFVGLDPIPVVHGMTVGELAQLINGEGWLANGLRCNLQVVPCANYDHSRPYELPVRPSPNLPNARAIYLYPSLCFFEGTIASVGRGTNKQFQVVGHPDYEDKLFSFVPTPMPGASNPPLQGQSCFGLDFSQVPIDSLRQIRRLEIGLVKDFYEKMPNKEGFFLKNNFFNLLAGDTLLQWQIKQGISADSIRNTWTNDLNSFKAIRKKYLLYQDFE
jgi:uncharacterized protein YbbC (DUF1343 family)